MNKIPLIYKLFFLCILFILIGATGYFIGQHFTERKFKLVVAKQSLIDVSRNTQLLEMGQGEISNQYRKVINVNIARHMVNVLNYNSLGFDKKEKEYQRKVFSRLNIIWSKYPPFSEGEFSGKSSLEYLHDIADYINSINKADINTLESKE